MFVALSWNLPHDYHGVQEHHGVEEHYGFPVFKVIIMYEACLSEKFPSSLTTPDIFKQLGSYERPNYPLQVGV